MFEDEIDRYKTYDANGIHYTFKHLLDPEGVPITDPESYERTSAAIGYAVFDRSSDHSVEDVFRRADKEMYTKKRVMKGE